MRIPPAHPRYGSLVLRERLVRGVRAGLAVEHGLIAHGRGEACDYLMGERTTAPARRAARAAAALLLTSRRPVISVNGNTAAIAGREAVALARAVPARIEVNLFHRTEARVRRIAAYLEKLGAVGVLGAGAGKRLPLDHPRGRCTEEGIYSADAVVVPLEDGDRAEALVRMGKSVIAIDLNPLSRTARCATVTVVDNVVRALPCITGRVGALRHRSADRLLAIVDAFDNRRNLREALGLIKKGF